MIDLFTESAGGKDSETFRREYLCVGGSTSVTVKYPDGTIRDVTVKDLRNELLKAVQRLDTKGEE
jgi:hypothetical protein